MYPKKVTHLTHPPSHLQAPTWSKQEIKVKVQVQEIKVQVQEINVQVQETKPGKPVHHTEHHLHCQDLHRFPGQPHQPR